MTNSERKLKQEWVRLSKETDIQVKDDEEIYWCFGNEKACLRLWYEYTKHGNNIRNRFSFGYSKNLETWYFSLRYSKGIETGAELEPEIYQWNDIEKCLPEENVYVICRYDDYYFIGYLEDGTWFNHSAGDTILATDVVTVENWKKF
jgi:hypothetical protein